jgi:hypothetical protein
MYFSLCFFAENIFLAVIEVDEDLRTVRSIQLSFISIILKITADD